MRGKASTLRPDEMPRAPLPTASSSMWHGIMSAPADVDLAPRARGLRIADAVLAVCVLVGVVMAGNLEQMPQGVSGFLAIRFTVKNALLISGFAWAWPLVLTLCGLYAPSRMRTGKGEWSRLVRAGAVGCALALIFPLTSVSGLVKPFHALLFGMAIVPAAGLLRASIRNQHRTRGHRRPREVVMIGSGPLAAVLYRKLLLDTTRSAAVLGFVDSEPQAALAGMGLPHLGGIQELERVLMHRVVDDVFIGLPLKSRFEDVQLTIAACARLGVPASYSADLFGGGSRTLQLDARGAPVLSISHMASAHLLAVKRIVDVMVASILLFVLSPVMLGVAAAIRLTSPGPSLFRQERYGYMKRLFRMYKFRTMVAGAERLQVDLEGQNEASGPSFKIRADPRITRLGRFLRRTSLDELPQLWHVLTGEMSLVGPRPMATRDVRRFAEPWLMRRFSMRPGLTCLWQISGRSNLSFDRWIELDLDYIDRWSLWLDLSILARTAPAIIRGTGAV
jgi:exopolysaccharide biosynthesis polyprenyl glycosylphosphotransferase